MNKNQLFIDEPDDELDHLIRLNIKAMQMVSSIYSSSLSHEEFMDKTEEIFCELLEEDKKLIQA
jgi:hypothetical protein